MSDTNPRLKFKNMIYCQRLDYLPTETVAKLIDCIEHELKPKKYAVILHDKDRREDGSPIGSHIHAMLCFKNARSINGVAKLLGDKPQYIERWTGNSQNGFAYLVHATEKDRDKHQYSPDEVIANFDYAAELATITAEVTQAKNKKEDEIPFLLDALYAGAISKEELEKRLTGSQIAKYSKRIDTVWAKRLEKNAKEFRQKMQEQGKRVTVIWIFGPAGTGKTSLAKEQAKKHGTEADYYMSGSSRDLFQTYAGQHILILDELRPDVIPYHDLLRILDPFSTEAQTMAPSRYYDKALACDTIIITTPYNPASFYWAAFDGKTNNLASRIDSFDQLRRRISLTIYMDNENIQAVEYDTENRTYVDMPNACRPNPYSQTHRPAPTADAAALYNSMFT